MPGHNRHYYLAGHSSVVRDVDPGQMYSVPYFTMYVSFYTDNEEQWGLLYMKGFSVAFSNRCLFYGRPQNC